MIMGFFIVSFFMKMSCISLLVSSPFSFTCGGENKIFYMVGLMSRWFFLIMNWAFTPFFWDDPTHP